jgi:endonuclease/exonuclease/phosphatase (EEP) superfamily protein YafD
MKRISWAVAAGLAGWAAVRLTGADRHRYLEAPAAPLLAFTPHVAAAAVAGWPLLRRRGPMAVAAISGAALAAAVAPRAIRRPQPAATGPELRVLTANMLGGRASADAIARLAKLSGADVVFLQELTDAAITRLKQAGLNDQLPYVVADVSGESPLSAGIYARFPLTGGPQFTPDSLVRPVLAARLTLPADRHAELFCVHPHPPAPPSSRRKIAQWRAELGALPSAGDPPRVLAGDFNTTADQAQFRMLLALGHHDAAIEAGLGLVPTWGPGGSPALLTLDHVLVDARCAVLAAAVHRLPGSDHRAVFARLRLPS